MLNNRPTETQNREIDLSKFWAFRLINVVSIISIFVLLSILLIPIPYFHKHRKPCIIDLNLNYNGYSHAIKISSKKLPANSISVSFTTHNSDHIIGTTMFGDVTVQREGDYLARFVNCHYQDNRKGLPYRILIIDSYPNSFVFRRFIMNTSKSCFTQIDSSVYFIPRLTQTLKFFDVDLYQLFNFTNKNVYKTFYEDKDEKIITQYHPLSSHMFGNITAGKTPIPIKDNAIYRTVTTVFLRSLNIMKVVITTIYSESTQPSYRDLFVTNTEPNVFYETINELSRATGLDISSETFEIKRFESSNKTPVDYYISGTKDSRIISFDLKHEKFRYEIICADQKDFIVRFQVNSGVSYSSEPDTDSIDRVIILEYSTKEPKPPNFYIFDRNLYFNRIRIFKHIT